MSKVKIFLFLQFIFFSTLPVLAQTVDTAWVRRYNGQIDSSDVAHAVAVDGAGNVLVTGSTYDSAGLNYTTIKYSPSGDAVWVRKYNGPGSGDDVANDLTVDDSGNVYVTGRSYAASSLDDYATIKYSPAGNTLWVRRYNGPGNSTDEAQDIAVDGDGNVYVIGYSFGSGTDFDYATIKYSPTGDTLWVRRYNTSSILPDYAYGLAVDGNSNVYITGHSYGAGTSADYATIKYSPTGDTLWVRRYDDPGNFNDFALSLAIDDSGNVYVTGYTADTITIFDYTTIKYSPTGNILWVRSYNGPANGIDVGTAIVVDNAGQVYVTGRSVGNGTSFDYATIKYSSAGNTLWVRRFNHSVNGVDAAEDLAVDDSGNVYVTGLSDGGGSYFDYLTIKYSSTGETLWVKRYNGPGNSDDQAHALAIDNSGNVYVAGRSTGVGTNFDFATIKYSLVYPLPIRQDTLVFIAYSPVNLVVTDPKLDSIGLDTAGARPDTVFNTILEGSTYDTTQDVSVPPDGEKDVVVTIPKPYVGEYKIRVVPEDTGHYSLGIRIDGSDQVYLANNVVVPETSTTFKYSVLTTLRGDVNKDTKRNLTDIIYLVNYVFKGGPAPNPADLGNVNCSTGAPNLTDIIYLVNYVFKGGKPPCS